MCRSPIVKAETEEGGPMYGPWTRVDRPRKRSQGCRMIGKQGSSSESGENPKKQTWKEMMQEKQNRERGMKDGGSQNLGKERKESDTMEMKQKKWKGQADAEGQGMETGTEKGEEGDRGTEQQGREQSNMEIELWREGPREEEKGGT